MACASCEAQKEGPMADTDTDTKRTFTQMLSDGYGSAMASLTGRGGKVLVGASVVATVLVWEGGRWVIRKVRKGGKKK